MRGYMLDMLASFVERLDRVTPAEIRGHSAHRWAFDRLDAALVFLARGPLRAEAHRAVTHIAFQCARWYKGHALPMPAAMRAVADRLFDDRYDFDVAAQSDIALSNSIGAHMLICTGRCHGKLDQRPKSASSLSVPEMALRCRRLVKIDSEMLRLHLERDWDAQPELSASWASTSWRCLAAALVITNQSRLAIDSGFLVRVMRLMRVLRQRCGPLDEYWRLEPHLATLILGVTRGADLNHLDLAALVDTDGLLESLAVSTSTAFSLRQPRSIIFRA